MIRVITPEGQFDVPGTAKDVDYEKALKITRNGQVTSVFRSWIHWIEIPDEPTPANHTTTARKATR